jgi:subtilisin family serine protease
MRRSLCLVLLAAAVLSSTGCRDKKTRGDDPPIPPDGGADAGDDLPPSSVVDGGTDGGEPDAGDDDRPLDERCLEACQAVGEVIDATCEFSSAAAPSGRRVVPASKARAFELASSEPSLTRQLSRLTGTPSLYAPGAGVVLVSRPTADGIARLLQSSAVVRELPVLADARGRQLVVPGRVVVRVHPGVRIGDLLARVGARLVRSVDHSRHTYLAQLDDPMASFAAAERLAGLPGVVYAEPSLVRSYQKRAPADPLTPRQWHLVSDAESGATPGTHIQAELAWQLSEGRPDTVIGIFDDGVDFEHPDLAGGIVEGLNVPSDLSAEVENGCCWHGSAVAGVAAAQANDIGLRGVCPTCSLMPIFQTSDDGMMLDEDVSTAELFTSACDRAAVVNNSWGPADGDPSVFEEDELEPEVLPQVIEDALTYCETEGRGGLGTVIVFAAGNGNEDVASDPFASHPLTVGVAAVDDSGRKSYYSDFGAAVDVSAPSDGGSNGIWTTALRGSGNRGDDDYMDDFGGTSSAAPVVSGLVGLVLSVNPALTAAQVRQLLRDTADKVDRLNAAYDETGHSRRYGHGRVNAYRAVREAERLASTCKPLQAESCDNGVDDDCNGEVDEGCSKAEVCAPCEHDAACASGLCAQTPNDSEPRCLEACTDGACGEGFSCQAGLCVPEATRCAPPAAEACNGVDDDLNGQVDEGACPADAPCSVDASCGEGELCLGGECVAECDSEADCEEGVECVLRTDRYGDPDGKRGCRRPFDFCREYVCMNPDTQALEDFVSCVAAEPSGCQEAFACFDSVW